MAGALSRPASTSASSSRPTTRWLCRRPTRRSITCCGSWCISSSSTRGCCDFGFTILDFGLGGFMSILAEHLPQAGLSCSLDSARHCLTCSDEAIEVTVLQSDTTTDMALVAMEEATIEIDVSLIDTISPGDRLLIHGGVAIAKL